MSNYQPVQSQISPSSLSCPSKKKYSKVNQTLRQRFLSCIIQHNMSIKDASQTLNINYSSAKAILASQRKKINTHKKQLLHGACASFRPVTQAEDVLFRVAIVCSTGGRETMRSEELLRTKPIHKLDSDRYRELGVDKQAESNTSQSGCL